MADDSKAKQDLIDQLTINVLGKDIVSKAKATEIVNKLYAAVEDAADKKVRPMVTKTILICAGLAIVLPMVAVAMEKRKARKREGQVLRPAPAH